MRLQRKRSPDAVDRASAQPTLLGQRAGTPMSSIARQRFQSHGQNSLDLRITDLTRRAWTGLIQQPLKTLFHKACPPLSDHLFGDLKLGGHVGVGFALGTGQNNLRPQGQRLRRLWPSSPVLQGATLLWRDHQLRDGASNSHRRTPLYMRRKSNVLLFSELQRRDTSRVLKKPSRVKSALRRTVYVVDSQCGVGAH